MVTCPNCGYGLSDPSANTLGKVSRAHPDTSKRASAYVWPRTGTQRMKVLRVLAQAPRTAEAVQIVLGLGCQSVTPRINELAEGGWIVDSGERRKTTRGGDAIVWMLTPAARAKLRG